MGLARYFFHGETDRHEEALVGISSKQFFRFIKKPYNPYLKHLSKVKRPHPH